MEAEYGATPSGRIAFDHSLFGNAGGGEDLVSGSQVVSRLRADLFATQVAFSTMPTKTTSQPTSGADVKAESTKTIGIRALGAAMVLTLLGELVLGMANLLASTPRLGIRLEGRSSLSLAHDADGPGPCPSLFSQFG